MYVCIYIYIYIYIYILYIYILIIIRRLIYNYICSTSISAGVAHSTANSSLSSQLQKLRITINVYSHQEAHHNDTWFSTEEKPGLTDLESFHGVHIIERIEESIGVDLLHDQYGNIMKEIVGNTRGQASRIKYAILQRWVTKGVDRSWRRLIEVLKKKDCNALVQDVQEKLRGTYVGHLLVNSF